MRSVSSLLASAPLLAAAACGSFGAASDAPAGTDGGTPGGDGGTSTADGGGLPGETCVPFSADLTKADITQAGFTNSDVTAKGGVRLGDVQVRGVAGRALIANVRAVANGSEAAYALMEIDLAGDQRLSSVDVSFDLHAGVVDSALYLELGCMLYAENTRAQDYPLNQLSFDLNGSMPGLSLQARTDQDTIAFEALTPIPGPLADWSAVTLTLAHAGDMAKGSGTLDVVGATSKTVPSLSADPRWVSIKCGIPYAQSPGQDRDIEVDIANIRGHVCTTKR
jgi:hypothetical protein